MLNRLRVSLVAVRDALYRLLAGWRIRRLAKYRVALPAEERRRFLLWVPGGMHLLLDVEGAIATAVHLRGHDVHAVICNGVAKACVRREVVLNPDIATWTRDCDACRRKCEQKLRQFNIPFTYTGDYVTQKELAELRRVAEGVTWEALPGFEYLGINVGRNVKSSILRYFKGREYDGNRELLREYVFSGLVGLVASKNAYARREPTNVIMSHGIYVDWGPPLKAALDHSARVTCWGGSYLHARFYFRHPSDCTEDLDFHRLNKGSWERQSKAPLSKQEFDRLNAYLAIRYARGVRFGGRYSTTYKGEGDRLREKYGLRPGRKVWGVMTHVNWDAVADYAPMLFDGFDEWIVSTLRRLERNPSVDWLIKIHPGEGWHNPGTGLQALLRKRFPQLPAHIRILGHDEAISPLDFYGIIDGAVTVYGTPGLELSCLGKPVIVAGTAHYSRKGFTHDPETRDAYFGLLDAAASLGPLTAEQCELARRYAYIYFIQRQVPFPPVENPDAWRELGFWKFRHVSAPLLRPGANRYVDFVAQRTIDNGEFVLPDELVEEPQGPGANGPGPLAAAATDA